MWKAERKGYHRGEQKNMRRNYVPLGWSTYRALNQCEKFFRTIRSASFSFVQSFFSVCFRGYNRAFSSLVEAKLTNTAGVNKAAA